MRKEEKKILLQTKKTNVETDMRLVCQFIERVLHYVAYSKRTRFNINDFKKNFMGQGVDWFIRYKAVRGGLSNLFKLKQEDRKALHLAFQGDIKFFTYLERLNYKLKFPDLPNCVKKVAKPFFEALYDDILGGSTGFRMNGLSVPQLRRVHVRKGYFEANKKTNGYFNPVCPACLGEIAVTEKDGYADLDHYLTKSIYPTLSISPDNLIPLCKTCNENIKGAQDPLKNYPKKGGLLNIFFPYHRPGIDSITVEINQRDPDEKFMVVTVKGKESESIRVENFEALFQLNERWSGKINSSLYETVRAHIISEFIDGEELLTETSVRKKLNKMYTAEMRIRSTVPDSYLLAQYINILTVSSDKFVGFYKDITETIELELKEGCL
ncbi:hypothetical protein GCM10008018_45750 [Paenibacillus marchantiophytorum]|uniref:HNH endonuclease n=1 Tax=Paenibacillus marchantiophytorum TaxID=1619310 RepID=A0ABQ1F0C4_9BACL|nr:hypothetical protein [Paenibacillus marchantiophytorum]GFZ94158.1 hypothetical protein GCM10008018_45750 [Paenibacillus marchantiophytorum]